MRRGLILFLSLICATEARATLEPAGSQNVLGCRFDTHNCAGQYTQGTFVDVNASVYNAPAPIISDGSAPLSPPNVVDSAMYLPSTTGGVWLEWYNNAGTREIYIRARIKIGANYSCSMAGSTKLMFLRAYENLAGGTGTNGLLTFAGCDDVRTLRWQHNTGGLNNGHICGGDSFGAICQPNVGPGTFVRGQWFDLEFCTRASTTTTSRDGVVWWAVNGVMAGRYTTVNYGTMVANEWAMNQAWDGINQGFTTDSHIYVDHLTISLPPSGGCLSVAGGGSPAPPPPPPLPPNKPTNLRVQ